jgi:hypothetical protein
MKTIRALRIYLALLEIGYTGLNNPLREITITKRIFMSPDFTEEKFLAALFKVGIGLQPSSSHCCPANGTSINLAFPVPKCKDIFNSFTKIDTRDPQ